MASYYETLGVSKKANESEVRQAFRREARKYHPDLNPGDEEAEAKFKLINEAYEVLSDSDKRKKYDRYGDQWKHADQFESRYGQGAGSFFGRSSGGGRPGDDFGFDLSGGLDDLLGQFGGRSRRRRARTGPKRVETPVTVTLEEAFSGTMRQVTGSIGDRERRIEVTIPPGVDTGSVVRFPLDKENELLLNVTVSPHARLQRRGNDLYVEVEVPFEDAVLGSETEIQTLKGKVRLKVPAESQNGQRIRLGGQGMPKLGAAETSGDLYATLRPTLPKDLKKEERELLKKFKEVRSKGR